MNCVIEFVGTSGGVMVCKINQQTFTRVVEAHKVAYSYALIPHLSQKRLINYYLTEFDLYIDIVLILYVTCKDFSKG